MLVKLKVIEKFFLKKKSKKQESASEATFKAWSFSFSFNIACKYDGVTAAGWPLYLENLEFILHLEKHLKNSILGQIHLEIPGEIFSCCKENFNC